MDNHPVKQALAAFVAEFLSQMIEDGGPSSTRLINMVVAGTGAWLLYYGARSGEVSWPWAACFMAYLAYGAGPVTLKEWFGVIRSKVGNETQSQIAWAPCEPTNAFDPK